jgi:hypothetical protein
LLILVSDLSKNCKRVKHNSSSSSFITIVCHAFTKSEEHEDLMDLLKKELHKKRRQRKGKELGEYDKEKRKKGNIDRMKVYYLDKHIFQA